MKSIERRQTIRELREAREWSQAELAHRVGTAPSTIYKWESGKVVPHVLQLRKLADVFGVLMDDISLHIPEGREQGKAAA